MNDAIISNPIIENLPAHLHQYIIPQDYSKYTAIDQAVWRYVMRKNVAFLSKVAHESYVEGLRKTGVSMEKIPDMYGMNRILKDIGWAAAAVDGFIPPAAFMEFQAYNVLVIAADIRQLENIEYTSAPDIIHESAGHAPIIANPEYAEYLRRLGEIGSKAISSAEDWAIYKAVRHLSQLKEQVGVAISEIDIAQKKVDELQAKESSNSEMARVRNLQWWSVEYGLIGNQEDYKIYGAGLLSSIGESEWCLSDKVVKRPYDLETADVNFDITRPQPQLFITPNFAHLSFVLDQLANQMALRNGGLSGITKLINSKNLGTIELSTGLQISGVFDQIIEHNGKPVYFTTRGETALSYREKELIGHSRFHHNDGYGSALGKLKGINLAIEDMSPRDLEAYDIYEDRMVQLEFEGDIIVRGEVITGVRNLQGKILLINFRNCSVKHKDKTLFSSKEELFHLAVGKDIVSAFAGPADLKSFNLIDHKLSPSIRLKDKTATQIQLEIYYDTLRKMREKLLEVNLDDFCVEILETTPNEWLLNLELFELCKFNQRFELAEDVRNNLIRIAGEFPKLKNLIESGIQINDRVVV